MDKHTLQNTFLLYDVKYYFIASFPIEVYGDRDLY